MYNSENDTNNNLNQSSMQQGFNNQNEFNNVSNFSKKNKNIFIILGVIIVLIIALFMFFNKDKNVNNVTEVRYGETLEIYEMKGKYDFDFQVLDIEKNHTISNSIFYTGECYALKVKIKNNSSSTLNLQSFINFSLVDASGHEIESDNLLITSDFEGSIKLNIPSGSSDTGYLYFYHFDANGNDSNINASLVDKLKISVVKELNNTNGSTKGEYNDYYVSLR